MDALIHLLILWYIAAGLERYGQKGHLLYISQWCGLQASCHTHAKPHLQSSIVHQKEQASTNVPIRIDL